MGAIAGLYRCDGGPVERDDLLRMGATMRHRGPDALDVWCAGSIGLARAALRTLPESIGLCVDGQRPGHDLVIAADVRLDNRHELLAALNIDSGGHPETTDSHLILSAYERWREGCVQRLLGDFAFVVWDGRARTLLCARDPFGVKPFYYHHSSHVFACASDSRALLCLDGVSRRLHEARIADFLAVDFRDASATFYETIRRLPPGHLLMVRNGALSTRRYWQLDPTRDLPGRSDAEYAEELRMLFTAAVQARLRTDVRCGSMLSGGLDSSSIVCVARRLLEACEDRPLHSFSALFPEAPDSDESTFIQAVIRSGGLRPHFVDAGALSPFRDIDRQLACLGEPFFAPNLFLHRALHEAAEAQGVRVLLDGLDGDLVVSHGIGSLQELARTGRWIALAREIDGLSRGFHRPAWRIFARHVLRPLVPEPVRRMGRALRRARAARSSGPPLLNPHFAHRIGFAERQRTRCDPPRTAREHHYRGLTQGLIAHTLEAVDHVAASCSIEPRYPFFDRRLAEYCLALPHDQKLHRGWTRIVMRRAMTGILPHEVQWRAGKADLGAGVFRRLRPVDARELERLVYAPSAFIWDYVDRTTLRRMYERALVSEHDGHVLGLWQAAVLESWLRGSNDRNMTHVK